MTWYLKVYGVIKIIPSISKICLEQSFLLSFRIFWLSPQKINFSGQRKKKCSVIHSAFSVGCDLPCAPHSPGQRVLPPQGRPGVLLPDGSDRRGRGEQGSHSMLRQHAEVGAGVRGSHRLPLQRDAFKMSHISLTGQHFYI